MGGIGSMERFLAGVFGPDRCGAGEADAFLAARPGLIGFFDMFLALSLELAKCPLN